MLFALASRSVIALLLSAGLAACDRGSGDAGQETAGAPQAGGGDAASAPAQPAGRVDRSHKGEAAPDIAFTAPGGKPTTLAAFRGKPVLLNLWATWCAPCIAEMPTLEALAEAEGERLRVLTVAQDLDPAKVPGFLKDKGFRRLEPYVDPKLALSTGYQASLPTTILYDAEGREVWRVLGGMDWNGAAAKALVAEAG